VKSPFTNAELIQRFVKEMNKFSGELGLEKTNFAVVHGLMNKNNISTASDIAYLSSIAI